MRLLFAATWFNPGLTYERPSDLGVCFAVSCFPDSDLSAASWRSPAGSPSLQEEALRHAKYVGASAEVWGNLRGHYEIERRRYVTGWLRLE